MVRKECEKSIFSKQGGLATGLSRKFNPRANGLASLGLLSCSATASMTRQLPRMLHTCANFGGLPVASHLRVQPRVSASLHNLEHFFTLPHSLPLHDSHLNTVLLIAKIHANLAQNKANKIVDKIQPYNYLKRFYTESSVSSSITNHVLSLCLHLSSLNLCHLISIVDVILFGLDFLSILC